MSTAWRSSCTCESCKSWNAEQDLRAIPHPDTLRLDWMEKHPGVVIAHAGPRETTVYVAIRAGRVLWNGDSCEFPILREAIDSAIAAEESAKETK